RDALPGKSLGWVVSEVGVRADPSARYTPNAGPQDAVVRIGLAGPSARAAAATAEKLRQAFARKEGLADLTARFRVGPVAFAALGRAALADLSLHLSGGRAAPQTQAAGQLLRAVRQVPGAADVQVWQRQDAPEYVLDVDRAKAAALGLSAAEVYRQVAASA